jgi:hypothetical protein
VRLESPFIPFISPYLRPAWSQIRTFCWRGPSRPGKTPLSQPPLPIELSYFQKPSNILVNENCDLKV